MQRRIGLFFFLKRSISKSPPYHLPSIRNPNFKKLGFQPPPRWFSSSSSQLADPTSSDGMTVNGIASKGWAILNEGEGDWKSHAAAIAQSIQLIKKRLQWRKMIVRLEQLSTVLNKPDLWDDPTSAGRVSREHGELMSKIKEVNRFEQELLEHIDMLKLAREENDEELESESMKALLEMRRNAKEKELDALLAGDNDSCSCFIEELEVQRAWIGLPWL